MNHIEKEQLIECLQMREGKLPADCGLLMEKVLSNKVSFAGKLQLFLSVLYSIQVY